MIDTTECFLGTGFTNCRAQRTKDIVGVRQIRTGEIFKIDPDLLELVVRCFERAPDKYDDVIVAIGIKQTTEEMSSHQPGRSRDQRDPSHEPSQKYLCIWLLLESTIIVRFGATPQQNYSQFEESVANIDTLLSQIHQSFLQELTPSPAQKASDVPKNGFGQPSFGSGNLVIGYSVNGTPLVMRVSGSNEDMTILSSAYVDTVRVVTIGDVGQAQKLAEILETLFGTLIVLDEPKRRIRRFAASPSRATVVPEGYVRDSRTGEIRPRRRAGRKPAQQPMED